jgi:tetratricopeptide (TPR) repeat protein
MSITSGNLSLGLTPQQKKQKTYEAWLRQVAATAARQPVLMIFEDVQWIDPSSHELLDLTIQRIDRLPVLLIGTFRPEFQAPWIGLPQVTLQFLNRLGRRSSAALIEVLAGRESSLPSNVVCEIIERSDGVPLFLEEITWTVLESSGWAANPSADHDQGRSIAPTASPVGPLVPATLHASLMARLDRLGFAAKAVAQIGAAIGREFSFEILSAVAQRDQAELREAMDRLVDAGLVFRRGTPPLASFLFKHALVRDIAYDTLLRGPRQALHRSIATAIEERFPEISEAEPERLAQHLAEAGLAEQAVIYWERAAQRSLARPAMPEAVAQLRKALGLLLTLPGSEDRSRKELDLLIALGSALHGAKGTGGQELGRTFARARELLVSLSNTPHLVIVFYGSFLFQLGRDVGAAHQIGKELLRLGRGRRDSTARMMAHRMIGQSYWHLGEQASARPNLERALGLYDPSRHRSMSPEISTTSGICLQYLSGVLILLGYLDQSIPIFRAAESDLEEMIAIRPRAFQISSAYFNFCVIQQSRRDINATEAYANRLVEFGQRNGSGPWAAAGLIWQGWARFSRGERETGVTEMHAGLEEYRKAGTPHVLYYFLGMLADVDAKRGSLEEGLALLSEATALQDSLAARCFASDLVRIKGDLFGLSGPRKHFHAEACYREAIDLARQQQTRLYELRAAMSLARLCSDQGRHAEARELLAPVYGWFTEGLDTPDLKEAKALLDCLQTICGRGNRSVAPVTQSEPLGPPASVTADGNAEPDPIAGSALRPTANATPAVPYDKPSPAVLPFTNMSGDHE